MRALSSAVLLTALLAGCSGGEGTSIDFVTLKQAPNSAAAGDTLEVCWRVDGSGSIPHTAVHWDTASHAGEARFDDYAGGLAFPGNEKADAWDLPDDFCAELTMPEGDLYIRAHAMEEAPGILSAEKRVALV